MTDSYTVMREIDRLYKLNGLVLNIDQKTVRRLLRVMADEMGYVIRKPSEHKVTIVRLDIICNPTTPHLDDVITQYCAKFASWYHGGRVGHLLDPAPSSEPTLSSEALEPEDVVPTPPVKSKKREKKPQEIIDAAELAIVRGNNDLKMIAVAPMISLSIPFIY
jgi:hypothetical protein